MRGGVLGPPLRLEPLLPSAAPADRPARRTPPLLPQSLHGKEHFASLHGKVGALNLLLVALAPVLGVVSFRRMGLITKLPEALQPRVKWLHRMVSGAWVELRSVGGAAPCGRAWSSLAGLLRGPRSRCLPRAAAGGGDLDPGAGDDAAGPPPPGGDGGAWLRRSLLGFLPG